LSIAIIMAVTGFASLVADSTIDSIDAKRQRVQK